MEYWIIYDLATGEPVGPGSGTPGTLSVQQLPDGVAAVRVPWAMLRQPWPPQDFAPLRETLAIEVDAQAEAVRMRFLTAGAGQAMTYVRKEDEARRWSADDGVATPFLTAEAGARGLTVAEVAAEVIARADAWIAIGAAIEGLRMGAKAAIGAATSIGGIVAASRADWGVIDAAAG